MNSLTSRDSTHIMERLIVVDSCIDTDNLHTIERSDASLRFKMLVTGAIFVTVAGVSLTLL